jgi:hypothetical protein
MVVVFDAMKVLRNDIAKLNELKKFVERGFII